MHSSRDDVEPLDALHGMLDEWRKLTQAEYDRIQASDWNELEQIQKRKVQLQRSIEKAEKAFSENKTLSAEQKANERKRLTHIAAELLLLEKKNEVVLSERIADADHQLKSSNKTIQGLRHLQKAYGAGRASFWQAYS